jgi:hypothetical protein
VWPALFLGVNPTRLASLATVRFGDLSDKFSPNCARFGSASSAAPHGGAIVFRDVIASGKSVPRRNASGRKAY